MKNYKCLGQLKHQKFEIQTLGIANKLKSSIHCPPLRKVIKWGLIPVRHVKFKKKTFQSHGRIR